MPIITYSGPEEHSPEILVAPASYFALPRGVPCELDESLVTLMLAADPEAFTLAEAPPPVSTTTTKKGATP